LRQGVAIDECCGHTDMIVDEARESEVGGW
jgi:hypothetical protein